MLEVMIRIALALLCLSTLLDLVGVLIAGIAVVSAARTGSRYFLDVAIVIALISFVGTVAYARYVETGERG